MTFFNVNFFLFSKMAAEPVATTIVALSVEVEKHDKPLIARGFVHSRG